MINPEEVKVDNLPYVLLKNKKRLPQKSGVYFVLDFESTIHYIGQSRNIFKRWKSHHKKYEVQNYRDVKIAYLLIKDTKLLVRTEREMINYFNPPLNGTCEIKEELKRVRKGVTLNTKIWSLIEMKANNQHISVNRYFENLLFDMLKKSGYIDSEEVRLEARRNT